ncbi:MAG: enoyl-CoA hydratase/isomerase family protein [Bacteroidota bacterium]
MSHVKLEKEAGVGTIEFFTEESNSLPANVLSELAALIESVGNDEDVQVVILKSGGDRTFCAGASFNELLAVNSAEAGSKFFMGFANVINAMRKCPKFILGRVQGKAVGGGIGLAAATDYCFATKFSAIKLSELALGIGPFIVSAPIERKMGLSAMSQIGINAGEFYDPHWAKEKGLYNEVFSTAEEMDQHITALAKKLSAYNPQAMREMKTVFWSGTDHWDQLLPERARISGELVLSEFTRDFIQQFKSKT